MRKQVKKLKEEVESLKNQLQQALAANTQNYYYSQEAMQCWSDIEQIPDIGHAPATVGTIIKNNHALDFNQKLNTSSYVNVSFEEEEERVAKMESLLARDEDGALRGAEHRLAVGGAHRFELDLTANEGSRHKAYAEMLGVDDYIRKPFAMDRLVDSVERLLA